MEVKIDEYVSQSLLDFGRGINTEVQIPSVLDGLKTVYRRVIYTALKNGSKMTKTAAISGNALATVHPHSSDAVDSVISALVRWGIFEGQGNHGMKLIYGDDINPSASRYTEARVDSRWIKLINHLMPYVPYKEAEMEGNMEPEFIPTPVPLILLFSGLGIGYGANGRYPMFTAQSLYNALIEDNPFLLEAPNGLEIDIDNSELWDLWNKGLGRITYKYKVEQVSIAAGYGTMISGSAEIFKPLLDFTFKDELAKGQVYILDQTASDIPQVFVGISPYVRSLSYDDVYEKCCQACSYTRMFRLTATDGDSAFCIPLKEWLRETYDNYIKLIETYKSDQISKLEFDYDVYDWIKVVSECLINHRDYDAEQLSKATGCRLDVVKAIMRKSISTLRNVDSLDKLKAIKAQIKSFKELDPVEYVRSVIDEF